MLSVSGACSRVYHEIMLCYCKQFFALYRIRRSGAKRNQICFLVGLSIENICNVFRSTGPLKLIVLQGAEADVNQIKIIAKSHRQLWRRRRRQRCAAQQLRCRQERQQARWDAGGTSDVSEFQSDFSRFRCEHGVNIDRPKNRRRPAHLDGPPFPNTRSGYKRHVRKHPIRRNTHQLLATRRST
jgi:hypothetical protein